MKETMFKAALNRANGKVFHSLSDFGHAVGIRREGIQLSATKKCRKCGTMMRKIAGTNVWICDGFAVDEDGNQVLENGKPIPCKNRVLEKV